MQNNKLKGLGINLVLKHKNKESVDTYIHSLLNLRMEWVRLEFNFFEEEEQELIDYLIESLQKNEIKILGLLTGLVPGNFVNSIAPSLNFPDPITKLEEFKIFCKKNVQRYKRFISHWEVWNEQNTIRFWIRKPEPEEYMQLLKTAVVEIKREQPEAFIVMGAIMGDDINRFAPFQYMGFLEKCRELNIDTYVDAYNFHPYIPSCYVSRKSYREYFPEIKEAIERFLQKYETNKPVWITEFGICPRWVLVKESEIAGIYRKLYEYCRNRDIPFFLWVLNDFPKTKDYSSVNPELYFGLLDVELKPKELFKSFVVECQNLH
ncbi:MAG: cellulase family glycosylhydrolase [Leptospiraceae bacterium]|nr:cellulase family glycosylhydrolase [Leptospiraceae bacterium]MCP5499688.1 cellulase family glycosylhydrolase [Leptospiraceae bacterium]